MVYDISYKTLIGSKPLRIKLDKIDGLLRSFDGTRYLTLFGTEVYDAIYNKIGYLISLESSITYVFLTILRKLKLIAMILLPIEKILTLYNVIILIKSVLNKSKNHYYYKIFLEKCSNHLAKK